jgi:hypothetical protein
LLNTSGGWYATVPGGDQNSAAGHWSFAAGRQAKANHQGSFVWADSQAADFASLADNQFLIRAAGNVGINKPNPATALDVNGIVTATRFRWAASAEISPDQGGSIELGDSSGSGTVPFIDFHYGLGVGGNQDHNVRLINDADGQLSVEGRFRATGAVTATSFNGNAGAPLMLGTTDNQPLEFKVNNQRALRLEPGGSNSVNVIGGWSGNGVAPGVAGATIGGGGASNYFGFAYTNRVEAHFGTVSGGLGNTIQPTAYFATIGGGYSNTVQTNAAAATIGGGDHNTIHPYAFYASIGAGEQNSIRSTATHATIGGGFVNTIHTNAHYATIGGGNYNSIWPNAELATIGGGHQNTIQPTAVAATISGGQGNTIQPYATAATVGGGVGNMIQPNADFATIPGGLFNSATNYAFAAGRQAKANHTGAFVWADATVADFASTANNQFLIRAAGGVGINTPNPATALDVNGTITATGFTGNGAGLGNVSAATLGGLSSSDFWKSTGNAGTAASTHFLGTTDDQALEFKVHGVRALRLEPVADNSVYVDTVNVVGGSPSNYVVAGVHGATIAGGGGAFYNLLMNDPFPNRVTADFGTVGGGFGNTSSGEYATVGGGAKNTSSGPDATVGGGRLNSCSGARATVPGGFWNSATGLSSFAAGFRAKANHDGSFVWADSQEADFASTTSNQFNIRASGGVRLSDDTPSLSFGVNRSQMLNLGGTNYGIGVQTGSLYSRCDLGADNGFIWYKGGSHDDSYSTPGPGGTEMMHLVSSGLYVNAVLVTSDRNAKENFEPVDSRALLDKVAAMPISHWNFKGDTATPHLGPMAQDFHAAFGLGTDDKHIATVDADGVALAAIQGLNQKLDETRAENAELKQRLEKLEQLISEKNGGAR